MKVVQIWGRFLFAFVLLIVPPSARAQGAAPLPSPVYQADVVLSASQLQNCFTAPVTVIPAPGSGVATQILSLFYSYRFGTVAYSFPNYLGLWYVSTSGLIIEDQWFHAVIGSAAAEVGWAAAANGRTAVANLGNEPVIFGCLTGNPTAGDGTMEVVIYYALVPL